MFSVHRLKWAKLRKCDGAAMVEFAIGSTVLIMFLLGIIEFGFLWYQKQVITNAAREAARYGVTYQTTTSGTRLAPKNFTTPYTIKQVADNYCKDRIPDGSWTATPSGPAYTASNGVDLKGVQLIVTVTCVNKMDLLSGMIDSLANITFSAKSIMNCE
jgi:Flp pilus assembly protein TadG